MTCVAFNSAGGQGFICYNEVHTIIDETGTSHTFEWHRYCGPIVLRKDGNPKVRIPKLFWKALDKWLEVNHI